MIQFTEENIPSLRLEERRLRRWIKAVTASHGRKLGDINYVFCDDERILAVNREFLDHDYYTDIITFDYGVQDIIAGDIYISIDTVSTNAEQFGASFAQELLRVIIHGILHLTGQGDKTPETQAEMTRKENEALAMYTSL